MIVQADFASQLSRRSGCPLGLIELLLRPIALLPYHFNRRHDESIDSGRYQVPTHWCLRIRPSTSETTES